MLPEGDDTDDLPELWVGTSWEELPTPGALALELEGYATIPDELMSALETDRQGRNPLAPWQEDLEIRLHLTNPKYTARPPPLCWSPRSSTSSASPAPSTWSATSASSPRKTVRALTRKASPCPRAPCVCHPRATTWPAAICGTPPTRPPSTTRPSVRCINGSGPRASAAMWRWGTACGNCSTWSSPSGRPTGP